MLMAKYSVPSIHKKTERILNRVVRFEDALERASILMDDPSSSVSKRHHSKIFHDLQKANEQYDMACALEIERESMRDLTEEIYNLSQVDPKTPKNLKEYMDAKRKLLQVGGMSLPFHIWQEKSLRRKLKKQKYSKNV